MEKKFKVGDKVRIKNRGYFHSDLKNGDIGTITKVNIGDSRLALKFGLHNQVIGFNLFDDYLELLKEDTKLIFRDNATILIKDGKRYVAKCCEGDTYDREKGLLVCLAKANGYTFDDLQKMLENAEDQGSKASNTVKEVKREAKVGEYIKIIKKPDYESRYNNGDKLKVTETFDIGVFVEKIGNKSVSVYHYEYVVLENYKPNKYKITLSEFLKTAGAKIAINLKTQQEFNEFLKYCHNKGHFKTFDKYDFDDFKDKTCFSRFFNYGYCYIDFYKKNGCKIYDFNEVDLNN